MSNNDLHDILKNELEHKFTEYFNKGLMAGWDACIYEINKQISNMTSAKAIKDAIKHKLTEAKTRANSK